MKISPSPWRSGLTVFFGFCIIGLTWTESRDPMPFEIGPWVLKGLGGIFLLFLFWSIYKDRKAFKKSRTRRQFLPTFLGILLIIGYGMTQFMLWRRDVSPVILKARIPPSFYSRHTLGFGYFIDFRGDNTFKLEITDLFSKKYRYGSYVMHDSILELDKSVMDCVLVSNRFIMHTDTGGERTLIQINSKGEEMDHADSFSTYH